MSGNVEDRWIWWGTRPAATSPTTSSTFPLNTQPLSQTVFIQPESYTTESQSISSLEVNTLQSSTVNDEDHKQPYITNKLSTILHNTSTINEVLLTSTPADQSALFISQKKANNFRSQWNWDGRTANSTSEYNILNSSVNFLPTLNTVSSRGNSSGDIYGNLDTSSSTYVSDLKWFEVSTTTSSFSLKSTSIPSYAKNFANYTSNDSTVDPLNGVKYASENYQFLSYTIICILLLLLIISIMVNATIFFTIVCRSYLRQTYFILYSSLAASDLLASIFIVPITILCILKLHHVSTFPLCSLVVATVILTTYVSVGTICSICIIRWWQFYNFSQTRTQEKLILLLLWTTGCGIYFSLVFKDFMTVDNVCTLDDIKRVLQSTQTLTCTSISIGLVVIITVNYFTITKVKKRTAYPLDQWSSKCKCFSYACQILDCTTKTHVKDNDSTDIHTLDGHTLKIFSPTNKKINSNTTSEWKTGSPSTQKPENIGTNFDDVTQPNILQCNVQLATGYYSHTTHSLEKHDPTVSSVPQLPNSCDKELEKSVFKGPSDDGLQLTGYESELESEHLYEVLEPSDVQEVIPQKHSSTRFPNVLRTPALPIPNTVEKNIHDPNPVIRRETTINNITCDPPADHTINTVAWNVKKMYESLPSLGTTSQVKNLNYLQPKGNCDIFSKTVIKDSITKSVIGGLHSSNSSNHYGSGGEGLLHSPNFVPFFFLTNEDSPCAGYMADLSATSSTHSTPHQKLSPKRRAERISALTSGRTISVASEDSEDGNINNPPSPIIPPTGRSTHHHQSCSQPPVSSNIDPRMLAMHPVRHKSIRISLRLVGLFAFAYLPLLVLQVLLSVMNSPAIVFLFIIYISFLLAIHPSLYGLQSPILKNAVRKLATKHRCSVHPTAGNQVLSQHIHFDPITLVGEQQLGEVSRQPTHCSSDPTVQPKCLSNTTTRPWSHPSSSAPTAAEKFCKSSSFSS